MTDFEYMKEALATELVMMLMEKEGMDMKSALIFFTTPTHAINFRIQNRGCFFRVKDMFMLYFIKKLQPEHWIETTESIRMS